MKGIRKIDGAQPSADTFPREPLTPERAETLLWCAMSLGERLLVCGAEISRVEDSLRRVCTAYGAQRVDVFTITSSIVTTIHGEDFGTLTQTRRIREVRYDLHRLHLLNQLSRDVCAHRPPIETLEKALVRIDAAPRYGFWTLTGVYALISGSFSLFFGGTGMDALVAAAIGALYKCAETQFERVRANRFLTVFVCSFLGGLLAALSVRAGFAQNADKISIGSIMLLIPGLALTNSIRDMFSGDTISGLLRFSEAVLQSMTVAFGFVLASWLLKGGAV